MWKEEEEEEHQEEEEEARRRSKKQEARTQQKRLRPRTRQIHSALLSHAQQAVLDVGTAPDAGQHLLQQVRIHRLARSVVLLRFRSQKFGDGSLVGEVVERG